IRMDQNALPKRLVAFALAFVTIPVLAFPTLMIVPWQMSVTNEWLPTAGMYVDAVIRVITAFAAATILGRYLARAFCPTADPKLDPLGKSTTRLLDLIVILVIPTMLVGWQASPAVIVVASLLAVVIRRWLPVSCDALGCFAISMPFALTFQLVLWRHLHAVAEIRGELGFAYWPSDGSSPWVMLSWLFLVALVPIWLREKPQDALPSPAPTDDLDDDDGAQNEFWEQDSDESDFDREDDAENDVEASPSWGNLDRRSDAGLDHDRGQEDVSPHDTLGDQLHFDSEYDHLSADRSDDSVSGPSHPMEERSDSKIDDESPRKPR
ncbi:MAG: hypothetical protein ACR2NZ_06660, partial [Rubripirellula sp.]